MKTPLKYKTAAAKSANPDWDEILPSFKVSLLTELGMTLTQKSTFGRNDKIGDVRLRFVGIDFNKPPKKVDLPVTQDGVQKGIVEVEVALVAPGVTRLCRHGEIADGQGEQIYLRPDRGTAQFTALNAKLEVIPKVNTWWREQATKGGPTAEVFLCHQCPADLRFLLLSTSYESTSLQVMGMPAKAPTRGEQQPHANLFIVAQTDAVASQTQNYGFIERLGPDTWRVACQTLASMKTKYEKPAARVLGLSRSSTRAPKVYSMPAYKKDGYSVVNLTIHSAQNLPKSTTGLLAARTPSVRIVETAGLQIGLRPVLTTPGTEKGGEGGLLTFNEAFDFPFDMNTSTIAFDIIDAANGDAVIAQTSFEIDRFLDGKEHQLTLKLKPAGELSVTAKATFGYPLILPGDSCILSSFRMEAFANTTLKHLHMVFKSFTSQLEYRRTDLVIADLAAMEAAVEYVAVYFDPRPKITLLHSVTMRLSASNTSPSIVGRWIGDPSAEVAVLLLGFFRRLDKTEWQFYFSPRVESNAFSPRPDPDHEHFLAFFQSLEENFVAPLDDTARKRLKSQAIPCPEPAILELARQDLLPPAVQESNNFLRFDRAGGFAPTFGSLSFPPGQVTVEFWALIDKQPKDAKLYHCTNPEFAQLHFECTVSAAGYIIFSYGASNKVSYALAQPMWHHYVFMSTGSTENGNPPFTGLFIDGQLVAFNRDIADQPTEPISVLKVGVDGNDVVPHVIKGQLAEFRIWRRMKPTAQLASLSQRANIDPSAEPDLAFYLQTNGLELKDAVSHQISVRSLSSYKPNPLFGRQVAAAASATIDPSVNPT